VRMIDGKPVVDADKSVVVEITQSDCERGSKKDPTKCAAALALRRITGCDEARVHIGCTYLRFGSKWLRYATPPSLKSEIISFDRGGGFYPGDFRLHPMPASNRLKPTSKRNATRTRRTPSMKFVSRSETDPSAPLDLQESLGDGKTRKTETQRIKTEMKFKGQARVFHRIKGVRERANARQD
jgi:hypothetical protein